MANLTDIIERGSDVVDQEGAHLPAAELGWIPRRSRSVYPLGKRLFFYKLIFRVMDVIL